MDPSSKSDGLSSVQEIPAFFEKQNLRFCIQQTPQIVPDESQIMSFQNLTSRIFLIYFNFILLYTLMTSEP